MESESRRKAMTLRLDTETAEQLEAIAQVEGVPVAEIVREALVDHIQARRNDAEFQKRLKASLDRNRAILERLGR